MLVQRLRGAMGQALNIKKRPFGRLKILTHCILAHYAADVRLNNWTYSGILSNNHINDEKFYQSLKILCEKWIGKYVSVNF